MFSIYYNRCIKSWKNQKSYTKNMKNEAFYWPVWLERNRRLIQKNDWKKSESNSKSITLNILHVPYNTEKIRHAYETKHNLNWENQIIFLIITDGEKWHYHAVKNLSALLRGIASKHAETFIV